MAGARRFDRDEVLDLAMGAFWRTGYEATSIQELEAATGLGRGSLYNAFGDKQALFLEALARYGATHGGAPLRHLANPDAAQGVRQVLEALVARMEDPDLPPGCLMTNTCIAETGSAAIADRAAGSVRKIEAAFAAAFARAQAAGQLGPAVDTRALGRFYCAVMLSLAVMHKARADRATLDDIIGGAMRAWPGA